MYNTAKKNGWLCTDKEAEEKLKTKEFQLLMNFGKDEKLLVYVPYIQPFITPVDEQYEIIDNYLIPKSLIFGNPEWPDPPEDNPAEQDSYPQERWLVRVREFCEKNGIRKRNV